MAGAEPSPVKRSSRRGVGRGASGRDDDGLSEYERHRLSRIRENQARLEALGLRNLASALRGPSSSVGQGQATGETKTDSGILGRRRRGKNDDDEGDDDYQPSEEDEGGEGFLSSEEEAEEEGQTPKRKGKKKISTNVKDGNKLDIPLQRNQNDLDGADDDADLLQAIALSLEEPTQKPGPEENKLPCRTSSGASTSCVPHAMAGGKRRKGNMKRPQMTKDELVAYFFSFDEAGSGNMRPRDLRRLASAHDFTWTDEEISDMIHLFGSNGDDKLSLEDFSRIVSRCNMLKDS